MILGSSVGAVALVLLVAALLVGASRTLGLVLGTLGLALPFVVPDAAPPHFVAALLAAVGLARVADLARDRVARPPLARVWQAFAGFDTRTTTLATPIFAWRMVVAGALFAALSVVSTVGIELASGPSWSAHLIRLGCGVVLTYSVMDTINQLVRAGYALGGVHVPPMQQSPVLSRTLAEFWGARWNLIVSSWLRREVFLPVARRTGAAVGLVAAFVVSALLHAYLTAPAVGRVMAAMMGSFFLAQCVLVFVERLLRVARWPAPLAHLWVVVALLATSPLFVEPVLRVLF